MNAKPHNGIAIPVDRGAVTELKGSISLQNGGARSFPEIDSTGWKDIADSKSVTSIEVASRLGGWATTRVLAI